MKRCVECGYRIGADVRRCPVCDGKMTEDSALDSGKLHGKVHETEDAPCLLEQKPSVTEREENETIKSRWIQASAVPMRFVPVLLVVLLMLMQSCSK